MWKGGDHMGKRKNVIFIFVDQWRGDCLGVTGHPDVQTPNLDALAEDGMVFQRAYAAAPSCIPARACVVTGRTPNGCGFVGYQDGVVWSYDHTLMTQLRDHGYQTVNVGKTHFYPQRAQLGFEINRLYDAGKIESSFRSDYHQWLEKESRGTVIDNANAFDGNAYLRYPWDAPEYMHPTSWITQQALDFLDNRDTMRPFFLQITHHRPHPPYDPPQFFYDIYKEQTLDPIPYGDWCDEYGINTHAINAWCGRRSPEMLDTMRKAYYGSISHVDHSIGRVITYLKSHGLYDNTEIIFTSDHGELLGDHHMYRKISPFEGSAKIPWIMKPAQHRELKHGCTTDVPVSHYDVMPTILSSCDIPIPSDVEGTDLTPLYNNGTIDRTWIHGEHSGYDNNGWQYIVDERYKYIWNTMTGREYFFDLKADPRELYNLANRDEYIDQITDYRDRLVDILQRRPEDGLIENGQLKPGTILPAVRPDFLKRSDQIKQDLGIE